MHHTCLLFFNRDGHGSFLRPNKINFGITLKEAIKRRYDDHPEEVTQDDMYVLGGGTQKTLVEVIGFNKVHEKLRCAINPICLISKLICKKDKFCYNLV